MSALDLAGVELSYTDLGSGDSLLLIHGTGAYSAIWGEVSGLLAGSHRVIVYDHRGFGAHRGSGLNIRTSTPRTPLRFSASGGRPCRRGGLERRRCDRTGPRRQPPRFDRLPGADRAGRLPNPRAERGALRMSLQMQFRWRLRRAERAAAATMYRLANSYTTGGNAFDRLPLEEQEGMLAHSRSTVLEMDQLTRPYPSSKTLSCIGCPVRCLQGSLSDPVFPRAITRLRRRLLQTEVVEIEEGAHMLHRDQPDAWVRAVLDAARHARHSGRFS